MTVYLDVFSPTIDGTTIDGANAAVANKSGFNASTGHYSIGKAQGFHGSYTDFFTFDPSVNISSFSLAGFSNLGTLETLHGALPPTYSLVGPVITFTQNYADGSSGFPFGGVVVGANSDGLLVQQVNGLFDLGTISPITHGEVFVGQLVSSYQLFLNTTNLSLKTGTPPTLPIVFDAVGVAEPSSALMFAAAAVAIVAARRLRSVARAG